MKNYWEPQNDNEAPMHRYTNHTGAIVGVLILIGLLYACAATGYAAMDDEMGKYDHVRKQREALIALKEPIKFSLPEHYLEMTGERVQSPLGEKQ